METAAYRGAGGMSCSLVAAAVVGATARYECLLAGARMSYQLQGEETDDGSAGASDVDASAPFSESGDAHLPEDGGASGAASAAGWRAADASAAAWFNRSEGGSPARRARKYR